MALNVRPLEDRDVEAVVGLSREMSDESPRYREDGFNERKTRSLVKSLVGNLLSPENGCFVTEDTDTGELVGMIAGMIGESLTHDSRIASDIAVFIRPEHRGKTAAVRMIMRWEAWAWANGATKVQLGISTEIFSQKTVHIYERLGYKMAVYGMVKDKT